MCICLQTRSFPNAEKFGFATLCITMAPTTCSVFCVFLCVLLFCVCPSVRLSVSTFFSALTAIICCKFVGFQHLDVSSRDLVSGTDCALLFFQSRLNVTTNQTLFQLIQLDLTTDEIIFQRMFQREFLISKVISYNFIIMFLKISERNVISF